MSFRTTRFGVLVRKATEKRTRLLKQAYWAVHPRSAEGPRVLLIVGCQRSGTSLLSRCFEADFRTTVFQEESEVTGGAGGRLRLRPIEDVNRILRTVPTPLAVLKPLVESHRVRALLDGIPRSRAVWMYRDFRDVANSNVKRFGSQLEDLRGILDGANWRGEGVSEAVRTELASRMDPSPSRHDAAALFWHARNRLFFDTDLSSDQRVTLCRYEDFVRAPARTLSRIYEFLEIAPPRRDVCHEVDDRSVGLSSSLRFDRSVTEFCEALLSRLDELNVDRRDGSASCSLDSAGCSFAPVTSTAS